MTPGPIGDPTTMVFAEDLPVQAILASIASSRTVVKLQGPVDPRDHAKGER